MGNYPIGTLSDLLVHRNLFDCDIGIAQRRNWLRSPRARRHHGNQLGASVWRAFV